MDDYTPPEAHLRMAFELVAQTHANGGLAPVDLERFWADDKIASKDPFGRNIPQVPLGIWMSDECIFDELGIAVDFWRLLYDHAWLLPLKKAYNDLSARIVGQRLLGQTPYGPARRYPPTKVLHEVFEAHNEWHSESWWLRQCVHNEDELKALLDRVEARDIHKFILPPNWDEEKARLQKLGIKPALYRSQRGPVTFATSIFGIENLIFLIRDNPDLAARFRDAILRTMLGLARVLDEEAGYTPQTAPHGFSFFDDNCCLLSPAMYEFFGYPVLKGVFEQRSPGPGDERFQHSDSEMSHLLPFFGKLGMTGVNFGPTVRADQIREHCPKAVIYGQLAPFAFSRNEGERIVLEFLRDFERTKEKRGLVFSTAGSINHGSRLTGMRLIMAAIQRYGRYDK